MTVPKLSPEYRVRWRRSTWRPNEFAYVTVIGAEDAAHKAAKFIAQQYDDVSEVVLELRQTTRWRHHDIVVLDTTPHHTLEES